MDRRLGYESKLNDTSFKSPLGKDAPLHSALLSQLANAFRNRRWKLLLLSVSTKQTLVAATTLAPSALPQPSVVGEAPLPAPTQKGEPIDDRKRAAEESGAENSDLSVDESSAARKRGAKRYRIDSDDEKKGSCSKQQLDSNDDSSVSTTRSRSKRTKDDVDTTIEDDASFARKKPKMTRARAQVDRIPTRRSNRLASTPTDDDAST